MRCNLIRFGLLAIGLVSIGACGQLGLAAPTAFFARDDSTASFPNSQAKFNEFTATLSSFGVDNIETAVGVNPVLVFGGTGITAATQGVVAQLDPGFGIAIDSQSLLELDAAAPGQVNTVFSFNQYINAFGVFVIQGGDGANSNPTSFRLRDTATNAFVDVPVQIGPSWPFNNVFFLGVSDTEAFNEVTILESADLNDGMLYDNVVAGVIVPEPSTVILAAMGGALAVVRGARGRRRR
jgi:hypothetical protein